MRVGVDSHSLGFRRDVLPPDLRPGEEKALFRREAIDEWETSFFRERLLQRSVSDRQTAEVGEILAKGQLPVHVEAVQHSVRIELRCHESSAAFELLEIGSAPPIAEISLRVVLRALIIEAVRHLLPDDSTHAPVVHRVIRVRIEKRRLHDSGREDDLVHRWVVIRIDRRRCHSPLGAIDWLTDSGQVPTALVLAHGDLIVEERSRFDGERGVITPLVGISDLVGEGCQLCYSLCFRSVGHPAEGLKSIVKHDSRLRTISSARCFAWGLKYFATYAWPSASLNPASVARAQRFSRGSISFAPLNVLAKRKSSFTNAELRLGAAASTIFQRR